MPPQPSTGISKKNAWIIVVGLILVCGASYYFYSYSNQRVALANYEIFSEAVFDANDGNYAEALEHLNGMKQTPATQSYANALAYAQADTSQDHLSLVKDLKSQLAAASDPLQKALIVNGITNAVFNADSADVHVEAFADAPLANLKAADSFWESMKNLADYSISIYPTARGYLDRARAEAGLAVSLQKSDPARSKTERQLAESDLKAADAQYEKEPIENSPLAIVIYPWFQYWRGFVYGTLAGIDPSYVAEATASYKRTVDYYEKTTDDYGKPYPIVEAPTLLADLADARLLWNTDGSKNSAEIKTRLEHFLRVSRLNPQIHTILTASLVAAKEPSVRTHAAYVALSGISPEFKVYLTSIGWQSADFK